MANLFEEKEVKSLVYDITYFLLSHQFVKCFGDLFRVKQGCGIGLLHAGDVADACFFSMVEKILFASGEYTAAGVIEMFKFRDDMLFLCSSVKGFMKLKNNMDRLADFFVLKIEEVSTVSMRFLDITVQRE